MNGSENVTLRPVDRGNWREVLALRLAPGQEGFVAEATVSLARCYVRAWGDDYEHLPMAICEGDTVVGYVTVVANPSSVDGYWIDDFMIDAAYQRQGLGRAALVSCLHMLCARYPKLRTIQLGCNKRNRRAAGLYQSLGFVNTGRESPSATDFLYALSGDGLRAYR